MARRFGVARWFIAAFLLIAAPSQAATLMVEWDPNTTPPAGYIVSYGLSSGNYSVSVDVGTYTTATLIALAPNTTYYIVVQAYDDVGAFSTYSNELVATTGNNPIAIVTPHSLTFGASKAGANGDVVHLTPLQKISLASVGATGHWTATSDQAWLRITNGGNVDAGQISVDVSNAGNLIGGSTLLSATITLTDPTAPANTITIPVTLRVDQTGHSTTLPFGQIDTPAQGASGVQGAIGVTGWVLDDIAVSNVAVYRGCVASDNPSACQVIGKDPVVYVTNGIFLDGARPDVAAIFPDAPMSHRAGWGAQILTSMLPHIPLGQGTGGQGPIALFVYATDMEGHVIQLGRSQADTTPTFISLDNDSIAKPFGTLDTPIPGSLLTGLVSVFGWALTPDSDTIAGNGDTAISTSNPQMFVFVDGIATSVVQYNQCRGTVGNPPPTNTFCNDDVANTFGNQSPLPPLTARTSNPTRFRNLDAGRGAIGSYVLDTTLLTNGLHSIAWSVTDDHGRTEGIGNRLFEVLNAGGASAPAPEPTVDTECSGPRDCVTSAGLEPRARRIFSGVRNDSTTSPMFRIGFDPNTPFQPFDAGAAGVSSVRVPELSRIEFDLGGAVEHGYTQGTAGSEPLPTGSTLDGARGRFAWTPPPGFLGRHVLVFVRGDDHIEIVVTVGNAIAATTLSSKNADAARFAASIRR